MRAQGAARTIALHELRLITVLFAHHTRFPRLGVFVKQIVVFVVDDHERIYFGHLLLIQDGVGREGRPCSRVSIVSRGSKKCCTNLPSSLARSSTMLKLALHIGQLFALSTQGFRQSLCRLWPQGSR